MTDMRPIPPTQAYTALAEVYPDLFATLPGGLDPAYLRTVFPVGSPNWLMDLHARWHDEPGNMMGAQDCGYVSCEFWSVGRWILTAVAVNQ